MPCLAFKIGVLVASAFVATALVAAPVADAKSVSIAVECGDTIGPGGSWALADDVGPCSSDTALRIVGPVRLDLNGRVVRCDGRRLGLHVDGRRAVLSDGSIEDCARGVEVDGDGRHRLRDIHVDRGDRGLGGGFFLRSDANRIMTCQAVSTERLDDVGPGFVIDGDRNLVRKAVVTSSFQSADDGFVVRGDFNKLVENEVGDVHRHAFLVTGNRNRLRRNVGVSKVAAFVVSGSRNLLAGNRGRGEEGLVVLGEGNTLLRNTGVGTHDELWAARVEGRGHVLRGNDLAGINGSPGGLEVRGSSHLLVDNLVTAGTHSGVFLRGQSHILRRNRAVGQAAFVGGQLTVFPSVGFWIGGKDHHLVDNVATDHGRSGFLVGPSESGHELVRNTSTGNNALHDPGHFDLRDDTPNCGLNEWRDNVGGTRNQSCVR